MTTTFDYQSKKSLNYKEMAARAKAMSKNPNVKSRGGSSNFFVFKISDSTDGDAAIMLTDLEPAFDGGTDAPDVFMKVDLVHFNLSNKIEVNKRTRATMRLTIEQEVSLLEDTKPLIWIAAAGIKIHDIIKNDKKNEGESLTDFNNAFGNRPIEIPQGKTKLSFDVIKHREPRWWQKVFQFIQTGSGKAVTAALGFPGVTQNVVGIVDRLFQDITKSRSEVLFNSETLPLVLTNKAMGDEAGDYEDVAVMNPGYYLICRGADLGFFMITPARYNNAVKNLIPVGTSPAEFLANGYTNPFLSKTFAIFKVGMQATELKKSFIYKTAKS